VSAAVGVLAPGASSSMFSAFYTKFLGREECRVIVVGLDGSGKTTIVYRLKNGIVDDSEIIPTIGFNVECVEYRKMIFSLWDLGGSHDARSFWRFYYEGTQAIIFVVDSSDLERMVRHPMPARHCCIPMALRPLTQDEAREALHRMLTEHELWDAPLLVVANKQDEPRAATPREITEHLQLFSLSSRNWYIVDTRAIHPDPAEANLNAGLDWLYEVLVMPAAKRQERAKQENRTRKIKA